MLANYWVKVHRLPVNLCSDNSTYTLLVLYRLPKLWVALSPTPIQSESQDMEKQA
jgi:hypothetical protein